MDSGIEPQSKTNRGRASTRLLVLELCRRPTGGGEPGYQPNVPAV